VTSGDSSKRRSVSGGFGPRGKVVATRRSDAFDRVSQKWWQHRACIRSARHSFFRFCVDSTVGIDGYRRAKCSREQSPGGSPLGGGDRWHAVRSRQVAGVSAGGNIRGSSDVKLACSRGLVGKRFDVVSVRQPKGKRGRLR
jgi:hypothetical protein